MGPKYKVQEIQLSERLKTLASYVPKKARVADIGTDHALLPVFLVNKGQADYVIAGDINPGPIQAASKQVAKAKLQHKISVREGDGLSVCKRNEVNTVVIAGMGGRRITTLLEQGEEKLTGVANLILSPHNAENVVRHWLADHGYFLQTENLIEEDGRFYSLLIAKYISLSVEAKKMQDKLYADQGILTEKMLYEMGPYLVRSPNDTFFRKWEQEISKRQKVLTQLQQAQDEKAKIKAQRWQTELAQIKEVLLCLQEGK